MKYFVVTSWSDEGAKLYGEQWVAGFQRHWPKACVGYVVTDAMIHEDLEAKKFFLRHSDKKMTQDGRYNYRKDLHRFAHKIFAIKTAMEKAIEGEADWLIWLDGDVATRGDIPEAELSAWCPQDCDVSYLSRKESWDHPECGFFAINLRRPGAVEFLREFVSQWVTDDVLKFDEQHDSHVFGVLLSRHPELKIHDLCPRAKGLDAFTPSPLGKYLDHLKGGRKAEFVGESGRYVSKEEADKITGGAFGGNLVLKTRNCRPESEIRENIKANLAIIDKWLKPVHWHGTELVLVSAGPSLKLPETIAEIRKRQDAGASVWCVKHSLQTLLDGGVVPWACVLLDPRPHVGASTHGFPREVMLANVGSKIKIFAATMVDPSVIAALKERGADIWGWHAAVGADEKSVIPKGHYLVPGGSTSVMRAITLGWMLGYRLMHTYAMDSCHFDQAGLDMEAKYADGTPRYFAIEVGSPDGETQKFLTDRDLLAQAQDWARVRKENPHLDIEAHGPGMVPFIDKASRVKYKSFEEVYGFAPA